MTRKSLRWKALGASILSLSLVPFFIPLAEDGRLPKWDALLPGRGVVIRMGRGGGGGGRGVAGLPKYPRPMLEPNYLPPGPWNNHQPYEASSSSSEEGGVGVENDNEGSQRWAMPAHTPTAEEAAAVKQRNKTCAYAGSICERAKLCQPKFMQNRGQCGPLARRFCLRIPVARWSLTPVWSRLCGGGVMVAGKSGMGRWLSNPHSPLLPLFLAPLSPQHTLATTVHKRSGLDVGQKNVYCTSINRCVSSSFIFLTCRVPKSQKKKSITMRFRSHFKRQRA